jgi:subtilisin family serine protease
VTRLLTSLIFILTLFGGALAPAQAALVSNEVVVKFRPDTTARQQLDFLKKDLRLSTRRTGFGRAFIVVLVPRILTPAALIQRIEASPLVEYAEQVVVTKATATGPSDPYFMLMQWNLQAHGFGIGVENAWYVSTGYGVPVAVLDTGCAYARYDRFYPGPDFDSRNLVPLTDWANLDLRPNDDHGHGTFLCSLIAAQVNNGMGAAGIAPDCLMMIGKVLNDRAEGRSDWLASGILEAVERGAAIILAGCGTAEHSRLVQDAIDEATSRGATVVMGAGNEGVNLDLNPGAHAVYRNAITVGATTREGGLAPYSNYGSQVSLVAPGGWSASPVWAQSFSPIDTLAPPYGFQPGGESIYQLTGTSVAAAHVAGVLALVLSAGENPDLADTARTLTASAGGVLRSFALIDAARAVGYRPGMEDEILPEEEIVPILHDVAVTQLIAPSTPTMVGRLATIQVGVANVGTLPETVNVVLRDDTTGVTLGSETVSLVVGQNVSLSFPWIALAPVGDHVLVAEARLAGDIDGSDNVLRSTAGVVAPGLAINIATFKPGSDLPLAVFPVDPATRTASIDVLFSVDDAGRPGDGIALPYTVTNGAGVTLDTGTAFTDGGGRARISLFDYNADLYRIDVSATKGAETATGTLSFRVSIPRAGR